MPIVSLPNNPPLPPAAGQNNNVELTSPDYQHSLIDSKKESLSSVITHIEGSTVITDWFSQVVSRDEGLSSFQPNQLPIYQQYTLIKNFEFKQQGSLSISDDPETSQVTITGEGITYPFIKPNTGDAFIMDIGDGRLGQFTVTSVTKLTYFKETCYRINFEMARYADQALISEMNEHVVKTCYFKRNFLTYGQNPVITSEEMARFGQMALFEKELLNRWLADFFSNEFGTILVPGQLVTTYDPFVVKFLMKIYNIREHRLLAKIRLLNCDGLLETECDSFWDSILFMEEDRIYNAFKPYGLIPVTAFSKLPFFEGVRFSGVRQVVGAKQLNPSVDKDYIPTTQMTVASLRDLNDMQIEITSVTFNNVLNGLPFPNDDFGDSSVFFSPEVSSIHPVVLDDYYVLTQNFYDKTINRSKFELMVQDFIEHQQVNLNVLLSFCESCKQWGRLEKFYYTPILLAMLKTMQRGL